MIASSAAKERWPVQWRIGIAVISGIRGYHGTTVARLEAEIGLSRGAIFNYFQDKWALFYELAGRDQHELTTLLVEEGIDATIAHLAVESPRPGADGRLPQPRRRGA